MMLREVCQYLIRNTFIESERISLQRIKPEFQVFPISLLSEITLAIQIKKIAWSLTIPQKTAGARRWTNPKAAIFRLYRSKSVANAARAFHSTLNHRHRICSLKLADEGFNEKKMPFHS
jgi:hypothetical protein